MNPMYRQILTQRSAQAQQIPPQDDVDSPTPWRAVRASSELAAILDANDRSVCICRPGHAARIIAAVNGVEKAS